MKDAAEDDGSTGDVIVRRIDSPFLLRPPAEETSKSVARAPAAALVILNTPLRRPPSQIFRRLWAVSTFRVCADGGANRLFDATVAAVKEDSVVDGGSAEEEAWSTDDHVPDVITGDLDSIRPDVRSHYESLGCDVVRDSDQDCNDLDKALRCVRAALLEEHRPTTTTARDRRHRHLVRHRDQRDHGGDVSRGHQDADDGGGGGDNTSDDGPVVEEEPTVYVYGAFGGRFDQEMGCIQALYKWCGTFKHRVVLYGDETSAFLLPPGVLNELRFPCLSVATPSSPDDKEEDPPQGMVGEGPTCGLIPLAERCEFVRTKGLQWNLDGATALEFGGLVSTSNRMVGEVVTVKTSHPLVFTTEMLC